MTPERSLFLGRSVLAAVIAIYAVLATVVALRTPEFESNDEPGHVQNVQTMVSGHRYTMSDDCRYEPTPDIFLHCSGTEAQQPPLYYLLLAGWQRAVGTPAQPPYQGIQNPAIYTGSRVMFVHPTATVPGYLLRLRLANVVLGALTILVCFLAVRMMTADAWTPVVAAALVGFMPRLVFLSAFVNNDNLVNLLGALLLLTGIWYVRVPTWRRLALVGGVLGLLLTTKLSTLSLVLVLPLLAALRPTWADRWRALAAGAAAMLLVSSWFFIQNSVTYGDPLALRATTDYLPKVGGYGYLSDTAYHVADPFREVLVHVPERLYESFWFQAGWNTFHWPWAANLTAWLLALAAIAGIVGRRVDRRLLLTLTGVSVAAALTLWLVAFQTPTYQGRYALVGLGAMAGLAALGVERWPVPVRWLLPVVSLCATVVTVQADVLDTAWT